ncbi:ABC transporter permease [Actinophytocola sp.]|uniref:ABC transporter permease n=1 Tax=Actinophytocola sp. TaxID=1872138 RepID=UPI002D444241|nr:ABC transporter permease [Actinophytocola sp.]HYQ65119.1 ABC transporter permease [Actinophytocola sp.]
MNILRSEWTKFASLRSTWLTATVTVVLALSVGALSATGQARGYPDASAAERTAWDPTAASLTAITVAQLAIGVLGVLVITAEYATGSIQPSLLAVPRRGRLLAAKAGVFTLVAVLIGQLIGFTSFFLGQAVFAGQGVPYATLGQPEVARAVIGGGLYLAALGLLGLGLGTVLRSTAGAIGTLVTVTLLVRAVAQALPERMAAWVNKYWPTASGERIFSVVPTDGALAPWPGFGLLCACVAAVGAGGYLLLRTKDA